MLIEAIAPANILDVGCGEGYTLEEVNKRFPDIHLEGSDLEEEVISIARTNLSHITFHIESADKLERADNSFDLVTMLEVLEHVPDPDSSIIEVKRVSRKYCIFSVPYEPYWRILNILRLRYVSELGNTPGHINHWSKSGFGKLLNKHFDNIQLYTVFPWNFALCSDQSSQSD